MSKPFGEMGGVGVSGAVLAQLFTSVFCLYPQHYTLCNYTTILSLGTCFLFFFPYR